MDTKKKTITATYSSLQQARKVLDALHAKNFVREDIGVAVNPETGEALIAVTTPEETLREGIQIVRQFAPTQYDERSVGWRASGNFRPLSPDSDAFMAVELAEKHDGQGKNN